MESKILQEIQQIRKLLSRIVGTDDLPEKDQFSNEVLNRVAEEYKKLSIERGVWIPEHEISKIIRKAPYYCGKYLIEKFKFTSYFKRGRSYYFNRKALIALNNDLKARNINLDRYIEYVNDRERFEKLVKSAKEHAGKKNHKHFHIPEWLRDINTRSYVPPSEQIILEHIKSLKEEFEKNNFSEYIDVYNDDHASLSTFTTLTCMWIQK